MFVISEDEEQVHPEDSQVAEHEGEGSSLGFWIIYGIFAVVCFVVATQSIVICQLVVNRLRGTSRNTANEKILY